jgi:uncharacterized protein YlxW (UPF0749 family)
LLVTGWRLLVPVTAGLAGLLLATSAVTARGTELRASRALDVSELIQRQQRALGQLTHDEASLRAQISAATKTAAAGNGSIRRLRRQAARLLGPAGLTALTGSGLSVSLDDAPRGEQQQDLDAGAQPDDLVIHQQDVQGVVNALWAGGADAMAIMGVRVVGTTAVRCVGNTLLLAGRVYSPPFVVTAIGDPRRLRLALDADPAVQVFRQYVAAYGLGYHVSIPNTVRVPAFSGPLELSEVQATS